MSKLAIGLGVLVLGSGASLTGAYALGAFDPDYTLTLNKIETDKEKDIRTEIKKEGCVKSLFGGVAEESDVNDTNLSSFTLTATDGKSVEGCLVVNWDKWKDQTGNKYQANFRFLGAMKLENKGFIVFATGDSVDDSNTKKLQYKGVVYFLEGTNSSGKISKKKDETGDTKKLEKDKLPKASQNFEGTKGLKDPDYGGFVTSSGNFNDMLSVLSDNKRNDKSDEYFRGYGMWKPISGSSSGVAAHSWTSNWDDWCNGVFGNNSVTIKSSLDTVKGAWGNSVIYTGVK